MAYRILIVDDEHELQNMVKEILTQAGYETDAALSCAQALERFQAGNPDAVLLDVNLPDGDGFSLFGQLRESRDVPVLFLSARDEDADRLRGLGLGADDYITKPFLPQELLLRLRSVLRRVYREAPDTVRLGDAEIDWGKGIVRRNGGDCRAVRFVFRRFSRSGGVRSGALRHFRRSALDSAGTLSGKDNPLC